MNKELKIYYGETELSVGTFIVCLFILAALIVLAVAVPAVFIMIAWNGLTSLTGGATITYLQSVYISVLIYIARHFLKK